MLTGRRLHHKMKKLFLAFILICFLVGTAIAINPALLLEVSSGGTTDYTADPNCMGAWYMNNNGGNETDRSGENETLTQNGGTIPTSATVPAGYSGTSRDFELGDSEALYHVDGGSTEINGVDQPLSFCAWIKFEADPGADATVAAKYEAIGGSRQYWFLHGDAENGMIVILSSDGAATTLATGATDLADDTDWHHVCFVYNDTDIRIYVGGALDSNGADNPKTYSSGIVDKTAPFVIGARSQNGVSQPFDGLIDEAIIFDRALSAAEVLEIYTTGISGNKGGND